MAKRRFVEDSDGEDEEAESPAMPAKLLHAEFSQSQLVDPQSSHAATAALTNSRSIDTSTASTGIGLVFLHAVNQD